MKWSARTIRAFMLIVMTVVLVLNCSKLVYQIRLQCLHHNQCVVKLISNVFGLFIYLKGSRHHQLNMHGML